MAFARALLLTIVSLQGVSALGDEKTDNVFGQPMTACGSDHATGPEQTNATGCTYAAMDEGAHQVCVTKLPHGFSSDTGQGPWSDEFTGQPWCICIWAYSNYILQNKDLPLRCESIPAVVLDGKYSMAKFKQCGSMSSTEGCGSEDIRRSIQSLCQQCDAQAPDDDSKQALKGKCDSILVAAPAAPMTLYNIKANAKAVLQRTGGTSLLVLGVLGLSLAAVSVGIATRKLRVGFTQQRGDQQIGQELIEDTVE